MNKVYVGYQGKLPVRIESSREAIENDQFLVCDRIEEHEGHAELVNGRVLFDADIISEARTAALSRIDAATSAAILAGFVYEVGGETLHFSYDQFDQQNFADTANAAMLAMQGVAGVPQTVTWNGWRNHTEEEKGELVRLTLDVQTFLGLYTGGALVHKATQMEVGGQRKSAIEAAETVEEINALLEGWGV